MTQRKTYAVHYGNDHLSCGKVLDDDFETLADAKAAAKTLIEEGYELVIIADTDGNEWEA